MIIFVLPDAVMHLTYIKKKKKRKSVHLNQVLALKVKIKALLD